MHAQGHPAQSDGGPVPGSAGRARTRRARETGFTLVELLVAILIIGVLASIALPTFFGYRQRALDAAVQSDLKGLSTEVMTFALEHGRFPADRSDLEGYGSVAVSEGNSLVLFSGSDGYVIYGTARGTGEVWALSSYEGTAPRRVDTLTTLPPAGPVAGTFGAAQPDLAGALAVAVESP